MGLGGMWVCDVGLEVVVLGVGFVGRVGYGVGRVGCGRVQVGMRIG